MNDSGIIEKFHMVIIVLLVGLDTLYQFYGLQYSAKVVTCICIKSMGCQLMSKLCAANNWANLEHDY